MGQWLLSAVPRWLRSSGRAAPSASWPAAVSQTDLLAFFRCRGWVVVDVLFHVLCNAQRALVALASPVPGPPDRDFVSYWTVFAFEADDPAAAAWPDRRELILQKTKNLMARMDVAAGTANSNVLLHFPTYRAVVGSINQVGITVDDFHRAFGIESGRDPLEATRWWDAAQDPRQIEERRRGGGAQSTRCRCGDRFSGGGGVPRQAGWQRRRRRRGERAPRP
jgi:hypothetical protein